MSTSTRHPGFLIAAIVAILLLASGSQAQSYKILHFFTGHEDGDLPADGPTVDAVGNIYGTSQGGYFDGCGNVFEFAPKSDGAWTETVLTTFDCSGAFGITPYGNVIFDKEGNLYGTTSSGGAFGNGTVFKLTSNPDLTWSLTVLHHFAGSPDDGAFSIAGVIFDASGNLYGSTCAGGTSGYGTVFQLKPERDGSWTETVLHSFQGGVDGNCPYGPPTFDGARNNLYGTTSSGGTNAQCSGCGIVFQLQRNQNWKESVLYSFAGGADGSQPLAGLTWARPDTLYGTTNVGGTNELGTVFQVARSHGTWTESVIHSFSGPDGGFPQSSLVFDGRNLYGTTSAGGVSHAEDAGGTVFKLEFSSGQWAERLLHSFDGPPNDGVLPVSGVALRHDATGLHIFGTTWRGGPEQCVLGCGEVYEITRRLQSTR